MSTSLRAGVFGILLIVAGATVASWHGRTPAVSASTDVAQLELRVWGGAVLALKKSGSSYPEAVIGLIKRRGHTPVLRVRAGTVSGNEFQWPLTQVDLELAGLSGSGLTPVGHGAAKPSLPAHPDMDEGWRTLAYVPQVQSEDCKLGDWQGSLDARLRLTTGTLLGEAPTIGYGRRTVWSFREKGSERFTQPMTDQFVYVADVGAQQAVTLTFRPRSGGPAKTVTITPGALPRRIALDLVVGMPAPGTPAPNEALQDFNDFRALFAADCKFKLPHAPAKGVGKDAGAAEAHAPDHRLPGKYCTGMRVEF